jgi:hypothetical protein
VDSKRIDRIYDIIKETDMKHLGRLVYMFDNSANDEEEIEDIRFDFGFTDDECVLLIED